MFRKSATFYTVSQFRINNFKKWARTNQNSNMDFEKFSHGLDNSM